MGLLDLAFAPLRAALSSVEHEAAGEVRDIEHVQHRVLDAAEAIRDATESIESHVQVIETLATSISPLTESVNRLTTELVELNRTLAPVAGAEREVSRLEHLFGRRRQPAGEAEATAPAGPPPAAPPGAGDPPS
jgi:predicted RNase H-like nuclease (RuvC/YqgF family)